jgi:alpha-galactosidase
MATTKVTVIGAGSASFGLNTLGSLMRSKKLRGSEIALVDRNADTLALIRALANRLNREWDAQMKISAFTHHKDALPGTKFVVSAIEVPPRERLWKKDFDITVKYGVRQPRGTSARCCRSPTTWKQPAPMRGTSTSPTRWCASVMRSTATAR